MDFIGLDIALVKSGFVHIGPTRMRRALTLNVDTTLSVGHRQQMMRDAVCNLCFQAEAKLTKIVIEGYSFNNKGGLRMERAETIGMIKHKLLERAYDVYVVAPNSIKLWLTGKGNAKKPDMKMVARERFGFITESDDEADALVLAKYMRAALVDRERLKYEKLVPLR